MIIFKSTNTFIGTVPIEDMHKPPFRSGHIYMKDAHCAEPIEKSLFWFYFSRYGWFYLQFTSRSPQFPSVSPTKKTFKRCQIYRKDAQCSYTDFLVHEFFLVLVLVFEIMADFVHGRFWCSYRSYASKSTVCRHNVDRQNGDRQNAEQTKCRQTKCIWPHFCKPDSDVNQFRLRSIILKHAGSREAALERRPWNALERRPCGVKPPTKKNVANWIFSWTTFFFLQKILKFYFD